MTAKMLDHVKPTKPVEDAQATLASVYAYLTRKAFARIATVFPVTFHPGVFDDLARESVKKLSSKGIALAGRETACVPVSTLTELLDSPIPTHLAIRLENAIADTQKGTRPQP